MVPPRVMVPEVVGRLRLARAARDEMERQRGAPLPSTSEPSGVSRVVCPFARLVGAGGAGGGGMAVQVVPGQTGAVYCKRTGSALGGRRPMPKNLAQSD